MGGASGDGVDERERPTAMHNAKGIEQMRPRLPFEMHEALADLDEREGHGLCDRRGRKESVHNRLQMLSPGKSGDLLRRGHAEIWLRAARSSSYLILTTTLPFARPVST